MSVFVYNEASGVYDTVNKYGYRYGTASVKVFSSYV